MHLKRPLPFLVLGLATLAAAPHAAALGWGRAPQSAVLGQSLDFNVTLRLDPGDVVEPKCVAAEVTSGDIRLPPTAVRVGVDTSAPDALQIRVITGPALEEPLATVTLAIGCPARLSRRFTLLVDPLPNVPTVLPPPVVPMADNAAPPATVAAPNPPPATVAAATPDSAAPARPRASAAPRPARKPAAAPAAGPRLQLDPVESVALRPATAASAVEDALQAVARAASAAQAAASAASAAEGRVAGLERELAQVKLEAERQRALAMAMQERASSADAARRWFWPAVLAAAVLAALAAWLAWRLREATRQAERAWRAAANATAAAQRPETPTSQLPMVTSEILQPMPSQPGRSATVPGFAPMAPALASMRPVLAEPPVSPAERTEVQPRPAFDEGAPRDVSIEELLDLEQQAEFFMVLGQEEAAIDLLVDHLRDTGGGSPLPYLKLLEIYKRRADREAYERTRARFNHRFNAYAPEWEADLASGRSLEDYPGVVPRLQQVWGKPLDAMAELEALLFRKSRGQLFDLPAYREVLFLYSLARDLLDREAADSGNVDLLLPLSETGDFGNTAARPYLSLEGESVFDPLPEDKVTAPIDLDLSQPNEGGPSIVDPLLPRR